MSTPLNQVYSHDNLQVNSQVVNSHILTHANTTNPTPSTAARTYKTRERLYYETDYVKATNSPIDSSNPNLFEPFVRKQSTITTSSSTANTNDSEELPPTASLHEYLVIGGGSSSNNNNNPQLSTSTNSHFSNLCSGSPMVINGVIGSPMKSRNPDLETAFVSQPMTRSITVFGFPPNCRNEVLLSFQSHGPIESFDSAAADEGNSSNWIHIVYESEWAAQKALNRNGTIFQPTGVMIGVIPMQTALERVNLAADSFMSPIKKTSLLKGTANDEVPSIFLKKDKESKIKSPNLESLPSESSLVTRAVNYIFGW